MRIITDGYDAAYRHPLEPVLIRPRPPEVRPIGPGLIGSVAPASVTCPVSSDHG